MTRFNIELSHHTEIRAQRCFCFASAIYCGVPPRIPNGMVSWSTGVTFGSTTTYICNHQYDLQGSANITCLENGAWQKPPVCAGW